MSFDINKVIKKADILIEALPYIQRLSGKTVIIKYGGHAMVNDTLKNSVMEDVTLLKFIGLNPILVHGGGPDITKELVAHNIETEFVGGLRVTNKDTMDVAQQVLVGKTNKEIVSAIGVKGGKAVGLCGIDGMIIKCQKFSPLKDGKPVDIGFVGDITDVKTELLEILVSDEYIPVIAPVGVDEEGNSYNINADTVAAAVAQAMKAEKLMLLTDVDGVKDAAGNIIFEATKKEVFELIENGVISGGMIPKVLGCVKAIEAGVKRVHIIDGRIPHAILLEIFTDSGIGTMITE